MPTIKSNTTKIDYVEFVGDTLKFVYTWKVDDVPVILSSYTGTLSIRTTPGDTPVKTITETTGLTLGDSTNNIIAELSSTDTSTLGAGTFYYDLVLTDDTGYVNTLILGEIELVIRGT